MRGAAQHHRSVQFGAFEVDLQAGELRKNGIRVKLQEQPLRILSLLLERPGEIVTRDEIQRKLWANDTFVDFDNGLNSAVARLREALNDSALAPRFIETVPRRGYRFLGTVEENGGGAALRNGGRHRASGSAPGGRLARSRMVLSVAAALGAGLLLGWFGRTPSDRELPLRKSSFATEPLAIQEPPQISPNGRYIAYTTDTLRALWVRDLELGQSRKLEGTEGARRPFWSPDSQYIGFVIHGRGLRKISVEGGPAVALGLLPGYTYVGGAWSPSGDSIVFASGRDEPVLHEVPSQGGDIGPFFEPVKSEKGGANVHPHFLPPGRGPDALLFAAGRFGDTEIMVRNLDTGQTERLAEGRFPVYSPSGHVLYVAGGGGLWAMPFSRKTLKPTGEAFLVATNATGASVAEDGALVYHRFPGQDQLVWLDRSGKKLGVLGQPQTRMAHPALSPDGGRVAVSAMDEDFDQDIWVHEVDRPMKTRITFLIGQVRQPVWSPAGRDIAFASGPTETLDIFTRPADGSGAPVRLAGGTSIEYPEDWSSDGRYLIYVVADPDIGFDLWYLERKEEDGGYDSVPFLQTPFFEASPKLSPDGRFLAYSSNESGRSEVYVRRFPEGDRKWQISDNGGGQPRWRSDGEELYYVEGRTLVAVEVSTAPGFSMGSSTRLFDHERLGVGFAPPNYDVSADGQRFVIPQRADEDDAALPAIQVVQNWFAEFKDRPGMTAAK